ncbi:peptidase M16 inactive domain protein [Arenibacter sp. NBRC 103722]|uniref:M16 family metallopeptidase n=1 Tax=Arenibacter sp. NBRC 103722 TaxID=1113929 RepID=UPI00085318D5|nr:insulinase family protein [Arenibacter sp. NBRC 103722]GBF22116.1 peptidase M16 inactive domain protein [Arenibacter sp. NBRC 103722]
MKRIIRILMVGLILQNCNVLWGQVGSDMESNMTSLDPGIRHGQLANGFQYYIKPIPNSGAKLSMRLYVKVGTFQEDPDQWQLAHFTEHMAFVRTQNFTNIGANFDILSSMGMKQGDVFALTAGNFTNYWFDVPAQNPTALTNGLLWFHDIISGIMEFRKEEVDGERGPFFQEYLFRNGRGRYLDRKISKGISECSKNPIHPDDYDRYVQTFDREKLVRFYRDWYRPDLSAIMIVGDVQDLDALEKQIRKSFSDLRAVKGARAKVDCAKEYLKRPDQFIVLEDSKNRSSADIDNKVLVHSFIRDNGAVLPTLDSNRSALAMSLLSEVINMRTDQASQDLGNTSYRLRSFYDTSDEFPAIEMKWETREGTVRESIEFIAKVLRHIKVRGIDRTEWENMKGTALKKLENDTGAIPYWLDQIRDHFVLERPLPKDKNLILHNWLGDLSLSDINGILSRSIPDIPQDIAVIAPKGSEVLELSEGEVREWILGINQGPVMVVSRQAEITSLMDAEEVDGLVPVGYEENEDHKLGIKEILLDNGAKVVLHKGSFKDNITVHGFSLKGTSSFSREEFYSSTNAPSIVRNSGVGELNNFQLNKYLQKTSIPLSLMPYMEYTESGIKGESDLQDFEKLMQLIYLYFTVPRKDSLAFKDWQERQRDRYHKQSAESLMYTDMLNEFMDKVSNDSIIFRPLGGTKHYKGIGKTDLENAYKAYSQIFGNARDFTFLISGNYEEKRILPLIRKYLGNLPNLQVPDMHMEPVMEHEVHHFSEIRSELSGLSSENTKIRIKYIYPEEEKLDKRERIGFELLAWALSAKLDGLRYVNKRDVFSARAHQWYYASIGWNVISIDLECSVKDTKVIRKDIHKIINNIKNQKLDDATFQYVAETYYNKYSAQRVKGSAQKMQEKLYRTFRFGEPFVSPEEVEGYVMSLTPRDILKSAQKILDEDYCSEFILKGTEKETYME